MPVELQADRSVGYLIADVSRLLRRNFNRRVQALGLSAPQWRAIVHLARSEGINQATLAESLEVQPITLGRLIDRMQAAGWVERRSDPQDRRCVQLYLTAKAAPVLAEMHEHAADTQEEALAGVPAAARKQLLDTLSRVKHNLCEAEAAAGQNRSNGSTLHDVRPKKHRVRR